MRFLSLRIFLRSYRSGTQPRAKYRWRCGDGASALSSIDRDCSWVGRLCRSVAILFKPGLIVVSAMSVNSFINDCRLPEVIKSPQASPQ